MTQRYFMDCLFCKLRDGLIPSHKIYEDDSVLAFLDIAPVNYGHTLVIPKKHYSNYEEIDVDTLCKVFAVVKKVGSAIKTSGIAPGYNTCVNNDPVAGQIIPHLHVHVIPRHENDGLALWSQGRYGDGEAEETLTKIRESLQ